MSQRYVVQIEVRFQERFDAALRKRFQALGIAVIGFTRVDHAIVVDGHLRLAEGEHQLDAHQTIKRVLGAASLRTRWLEIDEIAWTAEIRDAMP